MSGKDLNLLRNKIDKIDKDILKLIQKRANIAIKVGDIKNKTNPGKTLYKP
jgi:chorismate mutase